MALSNTYCNLLVYTIYHYLLDYTISRVLLLVNKNILFGAK